MKLNKLIIYVILTLTLISCTRTETKDSQTNTALPDYDFYQQTIYDAIKDTHTFEATPFISYILLGIDEDSNYSRHYVHAMISDIDKKLVVHSSIVYPFAFIFDGDTEKLVRYYYPDTTQHYNLEELNNNFPQEVISDFYSLPHDMYVTRIEKFHSTNMWNASTFYGIELE